MNHDDSRLKIVMSIAVWIPVIWNESKTYDVSRGIYKRLLDFIFDYLSYSNFFSTAFIVETHCKSRWKFWLSPKVCISHYLRDVSRKDRKRRMNDFINRIWCNRWIVNVLQAPFRVHSAFNLLFFDWFHSHGKDLCKSRCRFLFG